MNLIESLVAELRHEARSTRTMLKRVPDRSLPWKPHVKSRTLGELASHVANIPGIFIATLDRPGFDRHSYEAGVKDSIAGIRATFDRNIEESLALLQRMSEQEIMTPWKYTVGGRVVFELPRIAVLRGMGINHLIHHRGQLSLYLRLLDVPAPGMYGPTADET